MKINYILSDTTKGATTNALRAVVKSSESNLFENNIVIVPETKSIIIEKELLELSKNGAFANVYVYSFVRLLDRLGAVPFDKILSKQSLVIILRKIIIENIDELTCYKKTAKSVGFAEKIYDTIAQFKSSGVSVFDLKNSLSTESISLRSKLKDIIFLYEKYEEFLNNKYYDDCDKLALISNFAKTNSFLKNSNVFIVGFDNITFEMQTVLKDIAGNSKETTFSCVYFNDKRSDKYIQNNELYKKFTRIADLLKYPYVPTFYPTRLLSDFKYMHSNLFSIEKKKIKSNGLIKIFKSRTEKAEIDFVANTILMEVSNGKRFKDIGVLVCGLEEKIETIKQCFDVYKIPYFANVPQEIDNHFFVKFLYNSIELYINNLQSESVLKFILNPIFGAENIDIVMNYISETGANYDDFLAEIDEKYIKKYLHESDKILNNDDSLENENYLYEVNNDISKIENENIVETEEKTAIKLNRQKEIEQLKNTFEKFKNFYLDFSKILNNAKTSSDFINAINYVISYFCVEDKLFELQEIQKNNNLIIDSEITGIIFSKMENFNRQILNFLGQTEMSANDFLLIYKTGFSSCKVNLSPVSIDCVIIQENTDGFFNIKDLFIVNAVEGKFPSKIQDSGIILDDELNEAKNQIGIAIEPLTTDINRREKFRCFESLFEPKEKLFISYSEKSQDGKINMPSQVITKIIDLFENNIVIENYSKLNFVNYQIFENIFANKINDFENGKINLTDVNHYRNMLGEKISLPLKNYLQSLNFSGNEFELNDIGNLYFKDNNTSISQLETYFSCPYKFFTRYGLRLKENKGAKIQIVDVGIIIHRIVELFLKNIDEYKKLDENELNDAISKLLNFSLEELGFLIQKNKSLVRLIGIECKNLCKYILEEQSNSSFKFDIAEYVFEDKNSIEIKTKSNRNIHIEGKIDRIDRFGDYVRIIDYKTGKNLSTDLKSVYYGQKIQLAMYFQAIQNIKNVKIAGVFYFPIHSNYSNNKAKSREIYKMEGYILNNIDVVKYMDCTLSPENKSSKYVKLTIGFEKTGQMKFSYTNCYSEKEFENIKKYVNELSTNAINEILDGYIEPSPIKDTSSDVPISCKYCKMYGFCGLSKSKYSSGRKLKSNIDKYFCDNKELSNNTKGDK